jgi:hypothetical protein
MEGDSHEEDFREISCLVFLPKLVGTYDFGYTQAKTTDI